MLFRRAVCMAVCRRTALPLPHHLASLLHLIHWFTWNTAATTANMTSGSQSVEWACFYELAARKHSVKPYHQAATETTDEK